jgi:hypothetical protein
MEVESSLENAEGFLFVEHPHGEEVADLEDEAAGFLKQRCLGIGDVLAKNDVLVFTRKMSPQMGEGLFWIPRELGKRGSELIRCRKSLMQNHVVNRKGEKRVCFCAQVGDAVFDRSINNRIGVKLVGDGLVVALEEVLVDAIVFVEQFQSGF